MAKRIKLIPTLLSSLRIFMKFLVDSEIFNVVENLFMFFTFGF